MRDKDSGSVLNARFLAWTCGPGFGGQSGEEGRGRRWIRQLRHSLVGFVDPVHWLLQRPLLCEDVGMPAPWQ